LLGAVTGAVASVPYHLSWRETWETLDDWVLDVQPGADSGNHDLEYYTNRTQNVYIETYPDGSRALVIQALTEEYEGYNFTSGKVHSKAMLGPYGFFNVRATVPKGVGLWPAIWLYPMDGSPYGGWSANGEIDIMETICPSPPSYATIHYGGAWPNNTQWPWPPENEFPMDVDWSIPHNFGAEWQAEFIQFWFDSEVVGDGSIQGQSFGYIPSSQWFSMDSEGVHYPGNAPFNTPFNMILNLAIGGDWTCQTPGCCTNIESVMPAQMTVNFVEVWSLSSRQDLD
jgi:beta-glucanase (GH16 family)